MYNKKICQRLRAKIDSSLFPDQENGKYVLAGWVRLHEQHYPKTRHWFNADADNDIHYHWRKVYESDVVAHTGHDIRV